MKYFVDGNKLVITKDSFINLQESSAVFIPLDHEIAKDVIKHKSVLAMPLGDLMRIKLMLNDGIGGLYV